MPAATMGGAGGAREEWQEWEDSVLLLEQANKLKAAPTPVYAWPLLGMGVLAVSSAGVVFSTMPDVPPINLAAWRLQLTSLLLIPGAIANWRKMSADRRQDTLASVWVLLLSGACLSVHFGCWVWGLQHTSLPHSLLLVSATPIVLSVGALVLRKPISNGELLGSAFGIAGTIILAIGAQESASDKVTILGDLASLAAAVAVAGYLSAGSKMREWMPLFVYALPVTGIASLLLSVTAMATEGVGLLKSGGGGIFGWIASAYWWKVVYLAVCPGLMGHTVFNTLLKWLSPIVISLALMMEPVLGSLLGWAVGVTDAPSHTTWGGGLVLFFAMVTVTISAHQRQRRAQAKHDASLALSRVFADNDLEEAGVAAPSRGTATELTSRSPWPRDLDTSRPGIDPDLAHSWAMVDNEISPRP